MASIADPGASGADEASRGIPQLNARKGGVPTAIKLVMGLAIVLAILGGIAYAALLHFQNERQTSDESGKKKSETRTRLPALEAEDVVATEAPGNDAEDLPLPSTMPGEPSAPPPAAGAASADAGGTSTGHVVPALTPEQQAHADLLARRQRAPLMAFGGEPRAAAATLASAPQALMDGAAFPPPKPDASANGLREALQATPLAGSAASRLRDPNMTLTQASILPCILNTAMQSTVPGMVSCTLSNDVYSTNGRVLLLERGSRIVGEYNSTALKHGMSRVFVLWTRVETPAGVVISLDSPATDSLGRSGVEGTVNSHFWKRFGAAMLLSIVDDAVAYAAKGKSAGDGPQLVATGQVGNEAAAIAVENSIGIPPTLSVEPGGMLNVFVARDLYFGNVYALQRVAAR